MAKRELNSKHPKAIARLCEAIRLHGGADVRPSQVKKITYDTTRTATIGTSGVFVAVTVQTHVLSRLENTLYSVKLSVLYEINEIADAEEIYVAMPAPKKYLPMPTRTLAMPPVDNILAGHIARIVHDHTGGHLNPARIIGVSFTGLWDPDTEQMAEADLFVNYSNTGSGPEPIQYRVPYRAIEEIERWISVTQMSAKELEVQKILANRRGKNYRPVPEEVKEVSKVRIKPEHGVEVKRTTPMMGLKFYTPDRKTLMETYALNCICTDPFACREVANTLLVVKNDMGLLGNLLKSRGNAEPKPIVFYVPIYGVMVPLEITMSLMTDWEGNESKRVLVRNAGIAVTERYYDWNSRPQSEGGAQGMLAAEMNLFSEQLEADAQFKQFLDESILQAAIVDRALPPHMKKCVDNKHNYGMNKSISEWLSGDGPRDGKDVSYRMKANALSMYMYCVCYLCYVRNSPAYESTRLANEYAKGAYMSIGNQYSMKVSNYTLPF